MSGKSSDTLSVAEAAGFDSSTLTILALLSDTLQMMTAGPYGDDWIVVLFMPLVYLCYWIERRTKLPGAYSRQPLHNSDLC